MKKKRDHFLTVLFILILFAGLSLLLYPSISNYWNSFHSTQAIANYTEKVANLDHQEACGMRPGGTMRSFCSMVPPIG